MNKLLLLVIIVACAGSVSAAPAQYFGFAYLDFFTPPNGINISVWGNCYGSGVQVVASTVTLFGNGYYSVDIPIDDLTTPAVDEGCDSGTSLINFSIDGQFTYNPLPNSAVGVGGNVYMNYHLYSRYPFSLGLPANQSTITNSTPFFNWTHGVNSHTNFSVVIDDNSNFGSPAVNHADIQALNYTLNSSEMLSTDATYYWKIYVYVDGSYNESSSLGIFTLDTTPPTILTYSPSNGTWTNSSPVSVTIVTTEAGECRYSNNPGTAYNAKTPMAGITTSHTATLPMSAQGANSHYFQCQDTYLNTMNLSSEITYVLYYDNVAPAPGTVTINNGSAYTNLSTINISWSGFSDATSGIATYYYDYSNHEGTASGNSVGNTTTNLTSTPPQEGAVAVYVWASDNAGNIGLAANDSIIVDSQFPSFGSWSTNPPDLSETFAGEFTANVTLTEDTLQGLPQYRYKIGSEDWSLWMDMTSLGGSNWQLNISENWSTYVLQYLTYEVNASDYFNRFTNVTRTDLVDLTNFPPSFVGLTDYTGTEDTALTFTLVGTDSNAEDNLTYAASCCFAITALTGRTSLATWTATNDYVGQTMVTFNVTDGISIINQSVVITINPTDDAPVLEAIGDLQGYLYQPFTHYILASDEDNENSYVLDDDTLTFGTVEDVSWFVLSSYYNASSRDYYAITNFTPLTSHIGYSYIEIYVTDGTNTDSENITVFVGYCGDADAANEPRCDTDYETCSSCPQDCGECGTAAAEGLRMTILVNPRNCLNDNFTMKAYELWNRATCEDMGSIVDGYEVCGNLTGVSITVYRLEEGEWEELEEYETDDNGWATFVPSLPGEYKLVGEKRTYPEATRYLEISECLGDELVNKTTVSEEPVTEKIPQKEKPSDEPDTEPEEITVEENRWLIIIYYIAIPTLLIILIVSGYYYYEKEKNNKAWLLKLRISLHGYRKRAMAKMSAIWKKLKGYLGYK